MSINTERIIILLHLVCQRSVSPVKVCEQNAKMCAHGSDVWSLLVALVVVVCVECK